MKTADLLTLGLCAAAVWLISHDWDAKDFRRWEAQVADHQ